MSFYNRLYHDFCLPMQTAGYRRILKNAATEGYEFHTVSSFDNEIEKGIQKNKKYMILRRDVDTASYKVLKKLLEVEREFSARCSYYFRINTADKRTINEICEGGEHEVSYHYEEVASFAYKKRIKKGDRIKEYLAEIQDMFHSNLTAFRNEYGLTCRTVASHGDFINRKLGVANTVIVDETIRKECAIKREAYDSEQMQYVTCRIADQGSHSFVEEAVAATLRAEPVIYLLTHPAQWGAEVLVNMQADMSRIYRGCIYNLLGEKA